jgi:hypothetical protein
VKWFSVLAAVLAINLAFFTPSEARFYQPDTGRYLTADPIGLEGGIDPFMYVDNDPVNRIDPEGNLAIPYPVYPPYAPAIPALGPVVVPAIIAGGYIIVGGIIIMLTPTKITCDEEIAVKRIQSEVETNCQEHYERCLETSIANKRGSVHKHSRCQWCLDGCRRTGGWPASVPSTSGNISCNYGKYRRAR